MMKNKWVFLFFFSILLTNVWSCKTTRSAKPSTAKEKTADYLLKKLTQNQVNADWLNAKTKISYADDYFSVRGNANLVLKKDSFLWMSVRKLGFEVARALITTDSVFVLDRLNSEYIAEDIGYVSREFNIPADFTVLQAIILGNPVFFSNDLQSAFIDQTYHLYSDNGNISGDYWLNSKTFELTAMNFEDKKEKRNIELALNEYGQAPENQKFSYFRILKFNSPETGKVNAEIRFSKIELNIPEDVPFNIPGRYKRAD